LLGANIITTGIAIHILELTLGCYRRLEGLTEASPSFRWQTESHICKTEVCCCLDSLQYLD